MVQSVGSILITDFAFFGSFVLTLAIIIDPLTLTKPHASEVSCLPHIGQASVFGVQQASSPVLYHTHDGDTQIAVVAVDN